MRLAALLCAASLCAMASACADADTYPALYRDLNLPELPDGELVSDGRQATSLRDGLTLRVRTDRSVDDVRTFYSAALEEQGWEELPSRGMPGAPMAGLQATKDDLRYTMTATMMGDHTSVSITVVER